jgi:hypothetical protein
MLCHDPDAEATGALRPSAPGRRLIRFIQSFPHGQPTREQAKERCGNWTLAPGGFQFVGFVLLSPFKFAIRRRLSGRVVHVPVNKFFIKLQQNKFVFASEQQRLR